MSFSWRPLLVASFLLILFAGSAEAQVPIAEGQGTATIEGWPRSLNELLEEMGSRAPYLLPRVDSLALDYQYAVTDTTSRWSFVLSWRPAERVLYEGEVLPWREAPRNIRMTNVEFLADVRVDGEAVAEMIIGVDSMALGPGPDRFVFNVTVNHDRVFLDTPADEARRILSEGITLDPLVVERMGFTAEGTQRRGGASSEARQDREPPRQSRPPSIYTPRTRILVGWRVGPRPYYVDRGGDGGSRDVRPRRGTVGEATRGEETAEAGSAGGRGGDDTAKEGNVKGDSASRGGSGDTSDDDDEDDDETDLLVPAVGAAVAVAALGYFGGTIGLYGQGETPLGLAAGWTRPGGGVQLQASVNSAVIEDEPGQKLTAKALGFYDLFGAPVQPSVGLGVQIDPQRDRHIRPSVSTGLVGNFGRIVLYGGVDLVQGSPEVGISYNFRHGGAETSAGGTERRP